MPSEKKSPSWNKNTGVRTLNPLNLYFQLWNLNDNKTESRVKDQSAFTQTSFRLFYWRSTRDQRKSNVKTPSILWRRFLKSDAAFSRPIRWCLPLARPEASQRLHLPVINNPINPSIQIFTDCNRQQAAAVRFNHCYTRVTKNTLIYKLNYLHIFTKKETKHFLF